MIKQKKMKGLFENYNLKKRFLSTSKRQKLFSVYLDYGLLSKELVIKNIQNLIADCVLLKRYKLLSILRSDLAFFESYNETKTNS